mmetsp:Transcript_6835/g.15004  ORF Transcript_6835/g.15004 Transcript_6835/m.15004 type:complete len:212 (+) Transcript_6835:661-1296(+)
MVVVDRRIKVAVVNKIIDAFPELRHRRARRLHCFEAVMDRAAEIRVRVVAEVLQDRVRNVDLGSRPLLLHASLVPASGDGRHASLDRGSARRWVATRMPEVRVDTLNEVERVLVEVNNRLDVEGNDRARVVEDAQLPHDPHNLALPAHGTLLDHCTIRLGVNPLLHVNIAGAIVDRVLQVGVGLLSSHNHANNGHLVDILPVNCEGLVAHA